MLQKELYGRLVKAQWVEQVKGRESKVQKGVFEQEISFVKNPPEPDGRLKLILFAKLFRELLKGGPITIKELELIMGVGMGMEIQGRGGMR